jgi:hypothetical protein
LDRNKTHEAAAAANARMTAMPRLNDTKIRVRIAIACLVPLLAFVAFAFKNLAEKHSIYSTADRVAAIAQIAPEISGLIHELQKERGATAGFISSKGEAFAQTSRTQRPSTDKAVTDWRQKIDALDPATQSVKFKADLDGAQSALDRLNDIRSSTDRLSKTAQATTAYFTDAIDHLLGTIDSISDISDISDDARIMRASAALSSILKRKEFAGQERATGLAGFTKGEFSPDVYRNFVRLSAMQDGQMALFDNNATPAEIEFARDALRGAGMGELMRMGAAGAESPFKGNVGGVSGPQWFDVATKYIDALRPVEARLSDDLVAAVGRIAGDARWSFWGIFGLFVTMLAAVVGLSMFVASSITRPVGQLVTTMGILAGGDSSIDIPRTATRNAGRQGRRYTQSCRSYEHAVR